MKSVDIDGNGVCDAHEFEHLTRKLLNIDCTPQCAPCKFLHGKGLGDNWGKNRDAALAALAPPKKQEDSDLFTRVLSSPVARQEINRAKARGGTPTDPLKPAGEKNAAIHPKANKVCVCCIHSNMVKVLQRLSNCYVWHFFVTIAHRSMCPSASLSLACINAYSSSIIFFFITFMHICNFSFCDLPVRCMSCAY